MSTPSDPEPSGVKLVIEPDEDFSFVLEAIEALATSTDYTERILAITGQHAVDRIKSRLTILRAERDEAVKERDVLTARLAERAKEDAEIYRNAKSILAKIHGEKKLEVDTQPEGVVKTSQV